jgi:hypothetical protein
MTGARGEASHSDAPSVDAADLNASGIRHLRYTIAARVENTSLRSVAREIGMSPTGLKKFLSGTAPYSPTLRRLRYWYLHYAADRAEETREEDISAALRVLLHDMTPERRGQIAYRILECVGQGYETSGKSRPSWLLALLSRVEATSLQAPADPRPSIMGKYRGIIGSSDDYARFKQNEIDREDRRRA